MAKIAKKTATRISELFLIMRVANQMMEDKCDFKRWAAYSDEANLELREMGIDAGKTFAEIDAEIDAEFRAKYANFAA